MGGISEAPASALERDEPAAYWQYRPFEAKDNTKIAATVFAQRGNELMGVKTIGDSVAA